MVSDDSELRLGNLQRGPVQRLDAGTTQAAAIEARITHAVQVAERTDGHVWIAASAHLVRDPAGTLRGGQLHLDVESLAMLPSVGCYRCEQPLTERVLHRRCTGDPDRHPQAPRG